MIPDVDGAAAARFGLLLAAARRGDRLLAAEMLLSIPAADLEAIQARLRFFGVDISSLLTGAA